MRDGLAQDPEQHEDTSLLPLDSCWPQCTNPPPLPSLPREPTSYLPLHLPKGCLQIRNSFPMFEGGGYKIGKLWYRVIRRTQMYSVCITATIRHRVTKQLPSKVCAAGGRERKSSFQVASASMMPAATNLWCVPSPLSEEPQVSKSFVAAEHHTPVQTLQKQLGFLPPMQGSTPQQGDLYVASSEGRLNHGGEHAAESNMHSQHPERPSVFSPVV